MTTSSCGKALSLCTTQHTATAAKPSFLSVTPLTAKKGGLVTARHKDLREGVSDLAGKSFTPSHVRDDPLIYSGRAVKRTKTTPAQAGRNNDHTVVPLLEITEQKSNLMIRDL